MFNLLEWTQSYQAGGVIAESGEMSHNQSICGLDWGLSLGGWDTVQTLALKKKLYAPPLAGLS